MVDLIVWWERAACAGADVSLFFPDRRREYSEVVRVYCCDCDVAAECLADAMESEQAAISPRFGIRGGLTPNQRTELAKARRASTSQ